MNAQTKIKSSKSLALVTCNHPYCAFNFLSSTSSSSSREGSVLLSIPVSYIRSCTCRGRRQGQPCVSKRYNWLCSHSCTIPLIIALSAPTSTRPARVLANQNQSANLPARWPIRGPRSPSLESVEISSVIALNKSSKTGGGVWRNRCIRVGDVMVAAGANGILDSGEEII